MKSLRSPVRAEARRARQRGIATVEFTVVLPLVLMLVLVVAELGRAFIQYNILTRAAQDGARYMAEEGLKGQSGVLDIAGKLTETRNLVVYGSTAAGSQPLLEGLAPGQVTVTNLGGNSFSLVVSYPYAPMIAPALPGLLGRAIATTFTMQAGVAMRAI